MIFEVSHKTVYHYTAPVAQAHHLVHLAPREHERQRTIRHSLLIEPAPASRSDFTDYFGNPASAVAIESSHSELLIHSRSVIDVKAPPPLDVKRSAAWEGVAAGAFALAGRLSISTWCSFSCPRITPPPRRS